MLPLAVSLGDPAGIGPDLALAVWKRQGQGGLAPFFLIGDPDMLAARAARLGVSVPLQSISDPWEAADAFPKALPILPTEARMQETPGTLAPDSAAAVIEAIDKGVAAVLSSRARALVTLPITKQALYDAGFAFPGHTEYLGHLAGSRGLAAEPVMMLVGPDLRTVPVTIHVPLTEVPRQLTADLIVRTGRVVVRDLIHRFRIPAPRVVVAGLNPHAGEAGAMGREDIDIVSPAVAQLQADGIDAVGPLPADTLFHARARAGYDVALCMYHDQALIPAKTLAFDEAVNVTLGLPFVRTSPDHGTAHGLAGTGRARADSFIAALKLADRLSRPELD